MPAVAKLGNSDAQSRRVLYERAQAALVAELANIKPRPSAQEIDREYRALNDAIRGIEAELARGPGASNLERSRQVILAALARSEPEEPTTYSEMAELVELLPS